MLKKEQKIGFSVPATENILRHTKIDFVKRFDYPEFVKIRPGGSYEYHFADDPFFEYDGYGLRSTYSNRSYPLTDGSPDQVRR